MPSSVRVGSRPRCPRTSSYSAGSSPCFFTNSGVIGWLRIGSGLGGQRAGMAIHALFSPNCGKLRRQDGAGRGQAVLARHGSARRRGRGAASCRTRCRARCGSRRCRRATRWDCARSGAAPGDWPPAGPGRPRRSGNFPRRGRSAGGCRAPSRAGVPGRPRASIFSAQVRQRNSRRSVAHQGPGQEPRLAQNLEAVADPEHQAARGGVLLDRAHHRRKARDRPAAQVVAVGKAARARRPGRPPPGFFPCARHSASAGPGRNRRARRRPDRSWIPETAAPRWSWRVARAAQAGTIS